MSGDPAELPEDPDLCARWDALLTEHEPAVIEHAHRTRAELERRGLSPLDDVGWPLRPLFVDRRHLEAASAASQRAMIALRDELLRLLRDDRDRFREAVPLPDDVVDSLRPHESLAHPDYGLVLRPDGFLFDGRFVMTEPNMGNGYLVSCAYPELVFEHLASSPAAEGLGKDPRDGFVRPLERIEEMILSRLPEADGRPLVAFLLHHEEHGIILSWPDRVMRLIEHCQQRLEERGVDAPLVHESDLVVEDGVARLRDGRRVHLVFHVPIGTHFLYRPDLLLGPLSALAGPSVGDAPFLQPLAHLLLDKGTMPFLGAMDALPARSDDGFVVELAPTFYPSEEDASRLRQDKDRYVLKRSFEGKDTFVGVSTPGRPWQRALRAALASRDYVAQEYVPMPRAIMPMVVGDRIERVPVRVELSLLVIDGKYAGAFARYAPDAEGLVLSPPPEDMGFTVVWASG